MEIHGFENSCSLNHSCSQIHIPLEDISSNIWRGLIGIEDNRFLSHGGLDWRSILRAAFVNLRAGKVVQGGSTLTQQLGKNIFLSSENPSRKAKEAMYSLVLEFKYSKKQLIESYLNNVYWGSFQGLKIYGIKTSSLFYFNKHPNQLTEYEAAILIGMLKAQASIHHSSPEKNIKDRSLLVFKKLQSDGFFSDKSSS